MRNAVAQRFGEQEYQKLNLDAVTMFEDHFVAARVVRNWAVLAEIRENRIIVKLTCVAAEKRVAMEVGQNCFGQLR